MSAVVITPSSDPLWIEGASQLLRHGIHPTGLLLDGQTFDRKRADGNMRGIISALADLGVVGHIIGKDFRFEHITQRRQQRPTYKTLGTGRVVVVDSGAETEWVSVGQANEETA
jgi:hypothetical protein